jgi:hypothetical protein
MNTRALCITIVLSSISIVTNPGLTGIQIHMPLTSLYFHVWEIPLILVFLLAGFRYAVMASAINAVFLLAYFPGPSNPFYALASIVAATCTIVGIYAGQKVILKRQKKELLKGKTVLILTAFVLLIRLPVMAVVLYAILIYAYGAPSWWVINIELPLQAIYNVILMSYTISIAYLISKLILRPKIQKPEDFPEYDAKKL